MGILKKIDTAITVIGIAAYAYDIMHKTFKWYEKKYGKRNNSENITRPIIKGT